MKAIVHSEYGPPDTLRLAEVAVPVPREGEVLLEVRAASANPLDWHFMRGSPYLGRIAFGLRRPKDARVGVDVAGRVAAVAGNATQLKPGDEVFGVCKGAFAEHASASESKLAIKPAGVTFEQAASVPVAGLTALQAIRDHGRIHPGRRVLINGAAGGVGTFAVQIAKSFGAEVTGVCSAHNADLVRSIGADRVVDYAREDFTRSGTRYDLIVDSIGNHSLAACRRALTTEGVLVLVGGPNTGRWLGPLVRMVRAGIMSRFLRQKLVPMLARVTRDDLAVIRELLETRKVVPVIDRTYPLGEVAEAIRYLEQGHARGKVVITMEHHVS